MNLAQEYVTGVNQERRGMEATISICTCLSAIKVSTIGLLEAPTTFNNGGSSHPQSNDLPNGIAFNEIERLLEQGIRKGGRLSLEIANP